jgi:3-oxoadipate enol-lactonase
MVIGGTADQASPPDLVAGLARAISGADLYMLPDTGHLPPAESPGMFAALLQGFLALNPPVLSHGADIPTG